MRLIIALMLRLLLFILSLSIFFGFVTAFSLWQVWAMDPEGWERGVAQFLGWEMARYALSEAESVVAENLGLDPDLIERASLTEIWADEQWGKGAGDRALYISLIQGESADCQNAGDGFAAAEISARFGDESARTQIEALEKLLEIWKRHDIRAKNPIAAEYLPEDYRLEGVRGSVGAGALGCAQLLPATAIRHLPLVEEPFDLWQPQTAVIVMAAELHRLGWRKDADLLTKIDVLSGWNADRGWGTGILAQAEAYRGYLGLRSGMVEAGLLEEKPWWQDLAVFGLRVIGLLPDEETFRHEYLTSAEGIPDWQKSLMTAGSWQLPIANPSFVRGCGTHEATGVTCGWDLAADLGTPVFPAGKGVVTEAQCGWNEGYGCYVRVDHGNGIETRYAHLLTDSLPVKAGTEVGKESLLGRIGMTGNTTGPHLHFEVMSNGLAVDPEQVLGSFGRIVEANKVER